MPSDITERVALAAKLAGDLPLRLHLHDTRNTGVANAVAAVQAGVTTLDASIGGAGGCPFAPAATGNVATEDLICLFNRMGRTTGSTWLRPSPQPHWLQQQLGKPVPSALLRAA